MRLNLCAAMFFLLSLGLQPVLAAEPLQISAAWMRPPPPGAEVAAAYMTLQATQDLTLVKLSSPVAAAVQVHSMTMKNGVMEMRELPTLTLPRAKALAFTPGGLHVMFIDLKKSLKAGDTVALDVQLKNAQGLSQTQHVFIPVRAAP